MVADRPCDLTEDHERRHPDVHTVHVGSKGIRRRKPRRPLRPSSDEGAAMLVADTPNEYSTLTPYGAAMGMATFVGKLIRRVSREDRHRSRGVTWSRRE